VPGDAITIVYPTHRRDPRFAWFADSLAAQLRDDAPEVIVVDGLYSAERGKDMAAVVDGRFPFRHVPAKPNAFNGPYRRTSREYWAGASARNTGIVHATNPYVVFTDDLAVLMPGWWDEVRIAAAGGYVVGGAYRKDREMRVLDGELISSDAPRTGLDTRWDLGDDARPVPVVGGQLYGCTVGVPRDLLVAVNGFDELTGMCAGEDFNLGIRLQLAGEPIYYARRMLTVESDDDHGQDPVLHRVEKQLSEAAYMALLRKHGVSRRSTVGTFDAVRFVLDRVYGTRDPRAAGNHYELATLRPGDLEATSDGLPTHDWFDGRPLSEW
jgi:GT2 family glycosyltransferase